MPPKQLTPEQSKYFQERIAQISKGVQGLYAQRGLTQPKPIGAITPQSLQPVEPFRLPSAPTSAAAGVQWFFENYLKNQQGAIAAQRTEVAEARKAAEARSLELEKTMRALGEVPTQQAQLETEAGIAGKTELVTKYTNELEAEQRGLIKQIEAIEKNPTGMSAGAVQAEVSRVQREGLRKQADIALLQSAANRDLATAQGIIDKKIEFMTEPLKMKLEFDRFFFEQNKDDLTKAEQREFELLTKEDERAYSFLQDELKTVHDTYLKASENGAPENVLRNILSSQSSTDALQAAGQYMQKVGTQIVEVGGRKQLINTRTGQVIKDLGSTSSGQVAGFKLSNTGKGKLIGAGIPPASVTAIEQYLALYGFDENLKKSLGANADLVSSILGDAGSGFNYDDY